MCSLNWHHGSLGSSIKSHMYLVQYIIILFIFIQEPSSFLFSLLFLNEQPSRILLAFQVQVRPAAADTRRGTDMQKGLRLLGSHWNIKHHLNMFTWCYFFALIRCPFFSRWHHYRSNKLKTSLRGGTKTYLWKKQLHQQVPTQLIQGYWRFLDGPIRGNVFVRFLKFSLKGPLKITQRSTQISHENQYHFNQDWMDTANLRVQKHC